MERKEEMVSTMQDEPFALCSVRAKGKREACDAELYESLLQVTMTRLDSMDAFSSD